jgi:hypothetical protein
MNCSLQPKFTYFTALCAIIILQSCSWVNSFYISNTTNEPIVAEITLLDSVSSFPIFYDNKKSFTAYKLNENNAPDYNATIPVQEIISNTKHSFTITIQPKTSIQIGVLHNDNYTNHKQKFINGRCFNLKQILIKSKQSQQSFNPDEFDKSLKKVKGDFILAI